MQAVRQPNESVPRSPGVLTGHWLLASDSSLPTAHFFCHWSLMTGFLPLLHWPLTSGHWQLSQDRAVSALDPHKRLLHAPPHVGMGHTGGIEMKSGVACGIDEDNPPSSTGA